MKTLDFSFKTTVEFSDSIEQHDFILRCLPKSRATQTVRARLTLEPEASFDVQTDSFGNDMAVGYIGEAHDHFSYTIAGTATIDSTRLDTQEPHPLFLRETKRTASTPAMKEFLADAASAGMREMVMSGVGTVSSPTFTVEHLMRTVHETLVYEPGSTTVNTTAAEAFEQHSGVCQDYSHLMITLVRMCNIPARYVSGLTIGEGATHAWVEAFIDGAWHGFDPTRNKIVDESYLVLARGRDWADCPIERGTFQGLVDQTQTVFMQVEEA